VLPAVAQSQPGRILSTTTLDVYECNVDGSNCFIVAGHFDNSASRQPSVATNGTIAFNGNQGVDTSYDGNSHIFLMNADGTNVRQITANPPNAPSYNGDLWPTISPDGTKVAFLSTINKAPDGSREQEIYLVNADGSSLRQLTPFLASQSGDYSQSYMFGLAWSPDSTKVAFRGNVYTSQCGTYGGAPIFANVIGVINADGSNMQFLACDRNDGYVSSLDWSPDGSLIAWGRNVNHGAQGCSGCVGEPAIAFLDLTGRNRYSAGITSSQLGGDSCQGGAHCIHFSPDSSKLAYQNQYGQTTCGISCVFLINLDGSGQTNTTMQYAAGLWWIPGTRIPPPTQLTLAGSIPNVPPNLLEIWPGFSQQLVPTLSDSTGNLIFHSAPTFTQNWAYGHSGCINIGPFGLTFYSNDFNTGTISASNAGLTSNALSYKCWASPPCTFSLGSASTGIPAGGGPATVSVSADPGSSGSTCPWMAKASASWITLASGAGGSGNGTVSFNIAPNSGGARQGTITVAGLTYPVSQDAALSGPPVIRAIADAWDYVPGLAPGEWVTIAGTQLATGLPRSWNLTGSQQLPVSVGDVSVLFNGTPAVLAYVSSTQINALVPATVAPGPVQVIVQSNGLNSAPFTITATATLPSIYALPNAAGSMFFVTAALAGTATLIGNIATDPRVSRAARPGDTLDLYMIGLGATQDLSKFIIDQIFAGAYPVSANVTAMVGGESAPVLFAGLTSPGLYLVRIQVPLDLAPGSQPIQVSGGASNTRSSLVLMIGTAP
jgi:uncharacterized protein (TIGR03437 family)